MLLSATQSFEGLQTILLGFSCMDGLKSDISGEALNVRGLYSVYILLFLISMVYYEVDLRSRARH